MNLLNLLPISSSLFSHSRSLFEDRSCSSRLACSSQGRRLITASVNYRLRLHDSIARCVARRSETVLWSRLRFINLQRFSTRPTTVRLYLKVAATTAKSSNYRVSETKKKNRRTLLEWKTDLKYEKEKTDTLSDTDTGAVKPPRQRETHCITRSFLVTFACPRCPKKLHSARGHFYPS